MYPFSSLQSIYHVAFLSELSLLFLFICSISSSSASTLQLKRFLIQTAYNLRNETPSNETPSNDINEEEKEEASEDGRVDEHPNHIEDVVQSGTKGGMDERNHAML